PAEPADSLHVDDLALAHVGKPFRVAEVVEPAFGQLELVRFPAVHSVVGEGLLGELSGHGASPRPPALPSPHSRLRTRRPPRPRPDRDRAVASSPATTPPPVRGTAARCGRRTPPACDRA